MNVISQCYEELFGALGPSLFDCPVVYCAPDPVRQALQHCHLLFTFRGPTTALPVFVAKEQCVYLAT